MKNSTVIVALKNFNFFKKNTVTNYFIKILLRRCKIYQFAVSTKSSCYFVVQACEHTMKIFQITIDDICLYTRWNNCSVMMVVIKVSMVE